MTKNNHSLINLPHPHLRQKSHKVTIVDDKIQELINQMKLATLGWEDSREHEVGVALAAVQIDVPSKVVIIRNNFDDKQDRTFRVFINPKITKLEGVIEEDFEGCLSIKDIYGKVPRHTKVRISALDLDGREIRLKAEGFLARVFQHEIDHTNGVLFIDHIKENPEAFYNLNSEGKLEQLEYEKAIRNNNLLW